MGKWNTKAFWVAVLLPAFVAWLLGHLLDWTSLKLWSRLLDVLTLGSQTMRDAPFESAALNPYPIPSLLQLMWVGGGLVTVSLISSARTFFTYRRFQRLRNLKDRDLIKEESLPELERKLIRSFRIAVPIIVLALLADVVIFIPIISENEAIAARRVYESDRDIIAPYQSPAELASLQAQFAAVETRADFEAVMARINAVGTAHHLKLHRFKW